MDRASHIKSFFKSGASYYYDTLEDSQDPLLSAHESKHVALKKSYSHIDPYDYDVKEYQDYLVPSSFAISRSKNLSVNTSKYAKNYISDIYGSNYRVKLGEENKKVVTNHSHTANNINKPEYLIESNRRPLVKNLGRENLDYDHNYNLEYPLPRPVLKTRSIHSDPLAIGQSSNSPTSVRYRPNYQHYESRHPYSNYYTRERRPSHLRSYTESESSSDQNDQQGHRERNSNFYHHHKIDRNPSSYQSDTNTHVLSRNVDIRPQVTTPPPTVLSIHGSNQFQPKPKNDFYSLNQPVLLSRQTRPTPRVQYRKSTFHNNHFLADHLIDDEEAVQPAATTPLPPSSSSSSDAESSFYNY